MAANGRPPDAALTLSLAKAADEAGFDSVWVGDSLTAKPRLDPITTLGAAAAVTQRVRLGTAALLASLRHPVQLAQAAATLDVISRGRALLGVAVGGAFNEAQQREWEAAGVDPKRRASRLEETVTILKGLGSGEPLDHDGRHFQLRSVSMEPLPVQSGGVPILIAAHYRHSARPSISAWPDWATASSPFPILPMSTPCSAPKSAHTLRRWDATITGWSPSST